jgi:trehalose 6-phosphate phosphatase
MKTRKSDFQAARFFAGIAGSRPRALLLDYDGTLAPFRVERDRATVHPDLHDALAGICRAGRTRLVVISGRSLRDLVPLLRLEPLPELWGCHGWERLLPNGDYFAPDLAPEVRAALEAARCWAESARLNGRWEWKPAGIAVHWRGMDERAIEELRKQACAAWEPLARHPEINLRKFDGGLELRVTGRDKGYAVAQVLRELPDEAVVAYAGDDYTDEDAFTMLAGRGLSILVRPAYRETAADIWLRSPDEWTSFLNAWMLADTEGGRK